MRWKIRDKEADTLPKRAKRTIQKIICYPFANRFGLNLLSGMERFLSRHYEAR